MATPLQIARAAEKARKARVDEYKKAIDQMEKDNELFYENQLKREQISTEDFAKALKERSERYAKYSQEVLNVSYMTESEKADLSRKYIIESEKSLTEHYEWMKKIHRETLDENLKISEKYISDGNFYSGWEELGDDPISAYKRVDARLSQSVFSGDISYEEYRDKLSAFGSSMYADRIDNSYKWLDHEREMNRISNEEYVQGLERMQTYTRQYYDAGIISHREYILGMKELEVNIFNEKKAMHKEILKQAEEEKRAVDELADSKIKALEEQYRASVDAMEDEDREERLSELTAQERIYENSQTKDGKEKLARIREEIQEIKDEERKIALKEDFEAQSERVLSAAEKKKKQIDKDAAASALDLGLTYDRDGGYRLINDMQWVFSSVLGEQENFSKTSTEEIQVYNTELNRLMSESTSTLANGILTNFSAFASGINAIKEQIFSDVQAVNSLDFSSFGVSGKAIKTSVVYNDYGDKNISNSKAATSFFNNLNNLIAKGGRL